MAGDYSILYSKMVAEEITYNQLVSLRNDSLLIEGRQYRITNYVCTTQEYGTDASEYLFDIIVTATGPRDVSDDAYACHHDYGYEGNPLAGRDVSAWKLKYCLDNDTSRFAWANSQYGRGVIYWMQDEFGNEAPYDFINIAFGGNYTFGSPDRMGEVPAMGNKIYPYILDNIQRLNKITFMREEDDELRLCSNNICINCYNLTINSYDNFLSAVYINCGGTTLFAESESIYVNNARYVSYTATEKSKLAALPTNTSLQASIDTKQNIVINSVQHSANELQWSDYGPVGSASIGKTVSAESKTSPNKWSVPLKMYKGQKIAIRAKSITAYTYICSSSTPEINTDTSLTWVASAKYITSYTIPTTGYYTFGTDGTINSYTITDTVTSKFEALDSLVVIDNENV